MRDNPSHEVYLTADAGANGQSSCRCREARVGAYRDDQGGGGRFLLDMSELQDPRLRIACQGRGASRVDHTFALRNPRKDSAEATSSKSRSITT